MDPVTLVIALIVGLVLWAVLPWPFSILGIAIVAVIGVQVLIAVVRGVQGSQRL